MNQRTIKFRAWDKKEKFMDYGRMSDMMITLDGGLFEHKQPAFADRYELMQFTGLKDKNGKESFEEDIVTNGAETRIVRWVGGGFWLISLQLGAQDIECHQNNLGAWEVIGNIWETPELLK